MHGWSTLFWVLFLQFQLGVNVQWVTSAGVWGGGVWNGMARIRYGVDLGNSKLWLHRRPCMVGF